jgi:hypothetical protein
LSPRLAASASAPAPPAALGGGGTAAAEGPPPCSAAAAISTFFLGLLPLSGKKMGIKTLLFNGYYQPHEYLFIINKI